MSFTPKIVPPSEAPAAELVRQRVKRAPRPAGILECRCGCREVFEVRIGATMAAGRLSGGTVQVLCADCHRKGERVVVA